MLGCHAVTHNNNTAPTSSRKPVRISSVDRQFFVNSLSDVNIDVTSDTDTDNLVSMLSSELYDCAVRSKIHDQIAEVRDNHLGKWERLLQDKDDARVWQTIDWRGNFGKVMHDREESPSAEDFKAYFEGMLNPPHDQQQMEITTDVSIPVLDSPITQVEICEQIRNMKPDKACGPDGISPGIFSMLPVHLYMTIVTLFNSIFMCGQYPLSWTRAKIFTIHKKGNRLNPDNYRGISVTNSMAKLYDMVLCSRLYHWFKPCREQAGSQRKRGCLEHIVALRLLTDTARRKKKRLFLAFIDFSKAYDSMQRPKLLTTL